MTVKRSGLGRNLSALLSQSGNAPAPRSNSTGSLKIAIDCLEPGKYQPRGEIEESGLNELAQSIKQQGLLAPLLVREIHDGRYEIIAGERRWRACQMAGLSDVPVILKQVDDETAMAMALVENLQREDLNAMDQARAMQRLSSEFSLTHQQIATLLSKSRTAVSNYVRLLSLSLSVKKLLEHGDIDMGHARALLMLDEEQQNQVAQLILAKNLSVRETEKLVERIKANKSMEPIKTEAIKTVYHTQLDTISNQFNTKMSLKHKKSGKGSLVIHYENEAILKAIMQQLAIKNET